MGMFEKFLRQANPSPESIAEYRKAVTDLAESGERLNAKKREMEAGAYFDLEHLDEIRDQRRLEIQMELAEKRGDIATYNVKKEALAQNLAGLELKRQQKRNELGLL